MRRGRRGRGDDLPIRAEINVTSLVDVAFVLLVIFVITAPILQGGVEVNMPRGDIKPLPSDVKPFMVTLRPDGMVFVENSGLTLAQFEDAFPQLAAVGEFERVYVRADSLVTVGSLMRVILTVNATGKAFALVAEPKEPGR
ncbi:MAG: biopolymer transporter ExbD [Gemmatimonadetes bacterium]|nr:biopolymer transporter ExbD [Gemmatimonadota bacterium]